MVRSAFGSKLQYSLKELPWLLTRSGSPAVKQYKGLHWWGCVASGVGHEIRFRKASLSNVRMRIKAYQTPKHWRGSWYLDANDAQRYGIEEGVCGLRLRIGRELHQLVSFSTLLYHGDFHTSICSEEMVFVFGLFWAVHRGKLTASHNDGKKIIASPRLKLTQFWRMAGC